MLEVLLTVLLVLSGLLVVTLSFSVSKKILLKSRELFVSTVLLQEKWFDLEEKGTADHLSSGGVWQNPPAGWQIKTTPLASSDLSLVTLEVFPAGRPGAARDLETYLWNKSS